MSTCTHSYIEYEPPKELQIFLQCYWSYRTLANGDKLSVNPIIPDNCADIIFDLDNPKKSYCFFVGTMTKPIISNKTNLFGARFKPGIASSFTNVTVKHFIDKIVDVPLIGKNKTFFLANSLAHASDHQEQQEILNRLFRENLPKTPLLEEETNHAIDMIYNTSGAIQISKIAKEIGWSRQHLSRKFVQHTGITPKFFTSVVRVNNFITKYRSHKQMPFTDIALDCGYYDQSHMINEFKTMTGQTPLAFFKK